MNPTTHATQGSASAPVLYMALELSNRSWRLALGDGAKHRQVSVPAADLAALGCTVAKAKERFKPPASARVVSCYEAGRDGLLAAPAPGEHRHREPGRGRRQHRGKQAAAVREDRSARRRSVACKADPASRGRARRLECAARPEYRRGRRQAPAPGACSVASWSRRP